MKDLEFTLDSDIDENTCKGLIFRGKVSSWFDGNSVHVRKSLNLLKRKSCSGCEKCDWISEFLQEDVLNFDNEDALRNIEHNKLYTISFTSYRDWETGISEIDGYDFVECIEESGPSSL